MALLLVPASDEVGRLTQVPVTSNNRSPAPLFHEDRRRGSRRQCKTRTQIPLSLSDQYPLKSARFAKAKSVSDSELAVLPHDRRSSLNVSRSMKMKDNGLICILPANYGIHRWWMVDGLKVVSATSCGGHRPRPPTPKELISPLLLHSAHPPLRVTGAPPIPSPYNRSVEPRCSRNAQSEFKPRKCPQPILGLHSVPRLDSSPRTPIIVLVRAAAGAPSSLNP